MSTRLHAEPNSPVDMRHVHLKLTTIRDDLLVDKRHANLGTTLGVDLFLGKREATVFCNQSHDHAVRVQANKDTEVVTGLPAPQQSAATPIIEDTRNPLQLRTNQKLRKIIIFGLDMAQISEKTSKYFT